MSGPYGTANPYQQQPQPRPPAQPFGYGLTGAPPPGVAGVDTNPNPAPGPASVPLEPYPQDPSMGPGHGGAVPPGQIAIDTHEAERASGGDGWWPFPFEQPERMQTVDPATGMLKSQYQLDVTSARPESQWFQQQHELRNNQLGADIDAANRNAAGGRANAYSQLASSGGLDGGSRAFLASQGNRDNMFAKQNLYNQRANDVLGLRTTDTTNQIKADESNINRNLNQIDQQFKSEYDIFNTKAKTYAANQHSKAIANGDGSSSWDGAWWNPGSWF